MFVSYYVKDQETLVMDYMDKENGKSLLTFTLPIDHNEYHKHDVVICTDFNSNIDAMKLVSYYLLDVQNGRLSPMQIRDLVMEITIEANLQVLESMCIGRHAMHGIAVFHSDYEIELDYDFEWHVER